MGARVGPHRLSRPARSEWLVALAAVGREQAQELVAVVDVDELADGDDPDACSGPAFAERDRDSLVVDEPGRPDFAHDRSVWVDGLFGVGERKLAECPRRGGARPVALARRQVGDPLVGPLAVVVRAEALEPGLQ